MPVPATLLEAPMKSSHSDISAALETLLPVTSGVTLARSKLHRQLVAAALQVLVEWLTDQAQLLAEESGGDSLAVQTPARTTAYRKAVSLTPREQEVAVLIARGLTNSQIARQLVIATSTTERHVANILRKLDMRTRSQIAVWVTESGLVRAD
jgi:DNA-binding NarL/FixJ family response regulator